VERIERGCKQEAGENCVANAELSILIRYFSSDIIEIIKSGIRLATCGMHKEIRNAYKTLLEKQKRTYNLGHLGVD
jgi:hypothetical protein